MEDYKKKYENALERARGHYGVATHYNKTDEIQELEYIFPELKDSEDEKIRKGILNFLKEFECDHYRNLDFSSWIAWLEKRIEKSSWSEEDEKYFNVIYKELESYIAIKGYYTPLSYADLSWLKSLKERYTWKPSNEQIKGIKCAIKTLQHQLNVGDKRLDSLYDDLKKLR